MPENLSEEVYEGLPYGVVVVNGDRSVVDSNPAAGRMLASLAGGSPRCDELFDCRGPGGPCEGGCLAELAAEKGEALPEIRIDAAAPGEVTALWVTAAPLADGHTMFHLRPGHAEDRRRRSDPFWISGPELHITVFGRARVDSKEGHVSGQWLQQRPGHVLKYLVCERNRVVHAEEIAEALWPSGGRQSLVSVRHFIHSLRDKLEPDRPKRSPSSFVVTVQGGYAINRRRVRIDADEFEESIAAGLAAAARGEDDAAIERLEAGLQFYKGEFLADEPYSEWAYAERDRLRGLAAKALRGLATIMLEGGDLDGAGSHMEQLADLEPYDNQVQRELLTLWLAQGRRTEAARRYTTFRVRMLKEFGEEPDFGLQDLRPGRFTRTPIA
jgi:DNA-binding SARP family transcriptional activator